MTGPPPPFVHPGADELTYARLLLPAAARHAGNIAFREVDEPDGPVDTLGDHVERSLRVASGLSRALGLSASDRFAVLSQNSNRYANLWHAALLGGGIISSINTRLADAEIEYIIGHAAVRAVMADAANLDRVLAMKRRNALPEGTVVIAIDGTGGVEGVDLTLDELAAAGSTELLGRVTENRAAVLMYTGGTTGLPKGVVLSQRAMVLSIYRSALHQHFLSTARNQLVFAPMFHIGAVNAVSICIGGGTSHIMTRFDLDRIVGAIERYRIDQIGMPPSAIGLMLNHPDFHPARLASLKTLAYGSSPMPKGFIERLRDRLPWVGLLQAYGMTEAGAMVTYLTPADHLDERYWRSAGRPLPGVEISILDRHGNGCPPGTVGEVCVRSGGLLTEYWRNPEVTAETLRGGWYHTQDAGYLDDDGYLFLVDRIKDMIVSGGENVYSAEVESAISTHPAIAQVAVIGIPSQKWGEAVHAVVVLRGDAPATSPDDIVAYCEGRIARYKIPKSVEIRTDPLPLSGAMKVLKTDLRKPFWEGRETGIA